MLYRQQWARVCLEELVLGSFTIDMRYMRKGRKVLPGNLASIAAEVPRQAMEAYHL